MSDIKTRLGLHQSPAFRFLFRNVVFGNLSPFLIGPFIGLVAKAS
jgi:hypothetical protein